MDVNYFNPVSFCKSLFYILEMNCMSGGINVGVEESSNVHVYVHVSNYFYCNLEEISCGKLFIEQLLMILENLWGKTRS